MSRPDVGGPQETPQQQRRRVLQAAKSHARDHSWSFTGTVTTEMRAAATLAIEHELRNEPLEEWPVQEVNDLAGGIRDRIYNAFRRRQEKEAQRTRDAEERARADQRNEARTHIERRKKKAAYIDEAQRRLVTCFKTRALSPRQRFQALAEVLSQLDETLTGTEPLSEAYAAIDAVLRARIAEWDAYEAAKEAKTQEEWWEIAMVIAVVSALIFMSVKAPEILTWFLNIFSPKPAENPGSAPTPRAEAPSQPSEAQVPNPPRKRRVYRSPQTPAQESPTPPSKADGENSFF